MVRRVATQVHKQAARLLQSNYIRDQPAWFQAVLDHPPLPLPPRAPPSRPHDDAPRTTPAGSKYARPRAPRPLPVCYVEDDVRRQFFRDHPFEAYRARSLVESARVEDEHPVRGKEWTRLRQRGWTPDPETAIRYTVSLHEHHDMPLSQAYATAVSQFRALRLEAQIAAATGALEAEAYGGSFGPGEVDREFAREGAAIATWTRAPGELDEGELAARKKWKAVVDRTAGTGEWSRGENYTRLWREGTRPDYAPALTQPGLETVPVAAAGPSSAGPRRGSMPDTRLMNSANRGYGASAS